MNKYWQIFKISFKENKVTYVNTVLTIVSYSIIIFVFLNLWNYIYSDSSQLINGYSLKDMIWYLISGEIIAFSMSGKYIVQGINDDIKSGKIAYILNKPYNYYFYAVINSMGEIVFKYIFVIFSGSVIGMLFLGTSNLSFAMIVPMLLSFLLSALLCSFLYAIIGLIAFWIEDSQPFYWIISKTFLIFGVFFPPEFFPKWLAPIIKYSPVYSMYSGTGKLMAQFNWELFFNVTISQVIYIALLIVIGLLVYKRGIRKVNINGG